MISAKITNILYGIKFISFFSARAPTVDLAQSVISNPERVVELERNREICYVKGVAETLIIHYNCTF